MSSMQARFDECTGGNATRPDDWMPASGIEALVGSDPSMVWLKYHGEKHGFKPDVSPYEFLDFIGKVGRQFEDAWLANRAPDAPVVCPGSDEAGQADFVLATMERMQEGAPVIAQGLLWWAPERIFGISDLLLHSLWVKEHYGHLFPDYDFDAPAPLLEAAGIGGHYMVADLKFTSKLKSSAKAKDLARYTAQVEIYTYMLGHIQGYMPGHGLIICRDRIDNPLVLDLQSQLGSPLPAELAALRDTFIDIKLNGASYTPWQDALVAPSSSSEHDEPWHTARMTILREKMPGGDSGLLYYVGDQVKTALAERGFGNLAALLAAEPETIPFEECRGIGKATAGRMRALLRANREGRPVPPRAAAVPKRYERELFVDFEYFTSVNVDFETNWPALTGREMVFMAGVGWTESGEWQYRSFMAGAETARGERKLWTDFLAFLEELTEGNLTDASETALYHWTGAEVTQCKRARKRLDLPEDHLILNLPWLDLQKAFMKTPCAIPGAYGFGLKDTAKNLGRYDSQYDPEWPGSLDRGLTAMVMGWKAYERKRPRRSKPAHIINEYLEADCRALWQVLRWMRASAS